MVEVATTTKAPPAPSQLARGLVALALVYLGLAGAIPRRVNFAVGSFFAGLLVAAAVGVVGWRRMRALVAMRGYLLWSLASAVWAMMAGVAAWQVTTLYEAAKFSVWMGFIIPGLAAVLEGRQERNLLLLGWTAGVAYYVTVAGIRLATGRPVLDVLQTNALKLAGVNRNGVNIIVLFAVPFLLAGVGGRIMRLARWPVVVLSAIWLLNSGGRTALLGLLVCGLLYVVAQPTMPRRVVLAAAALLVLVFGGVAVQSAGGQVLESTNRLVAFLSGERSNPDEARILLARKAWHLAAANPAFGVGPGNFQAVDDPVSEQAPNAHVAELARTQDEHNTYLQVLAETGFCGAFAFLGTIAAIFAGLWRTHRTREVCATISAFGGTVFSVTFHSSLGTALFIPMAVAAGVALQGWQRRAPET